MKRFTATWTMAVASAVLMTAPAIGAAQTPPPTTPPSTTQPAAPTTPHAQHEANDSKTAAQEHLRKASAALADIKTAALPARAKNEVAEIKRRVSSLERTVAATDKASATGQANRSANAKSASTWDTEVAAIDRALTTLLGPDITTPSTVGTSGTTTPPVGNKAAAAIMLDAESRASLAEVRSHLTAFATAMAGGGKTGTEATPSAAANITYPTSTATTPATGSTTGQSPMMGQPPATPDPQPTAPTAAAQPMASGTQGDEQAARQHLTAARNTLSALTQLPASSQLTGDARTQVAQLIANFNELITTQSEWRESYGKVNANLTALLGPDSGASDPTNASGTAGAVGTSGSAAGTVDPAVREKLVELRRNLTAFEKAAVGGAAAPSSSAAATSSMDPAASSMATGSSTTTDPALATGTTGASTVGSQGAASGNADVMRHVAAIEGLLKMQDESGGLTLTRAQVEQLRTHWTALRTAIEKK